MKTLRTILLAAAALALLGTAASAQKKTVKKAPITSSDITEGGSFDDRAYTNAALGLNISVPDGLDITSEEYNKTVMDRGRAKIKAVSSKAGKALIDSSAKRSAILFQASSPTIGASMACGFEIPPVAGVTALRYAIENKQLVLRAAKDAKVVKDVYSKTIGGTAFSAYEIGREMDGITFNQLYLTTRRRGVMFFFVLNYRSDAGLKILEESLDTLEFEK